MKIFILNKIQFILQNNYLILEKEVVEGLREKVADNITDDILSNEDLKNKMNEIIEYIIRNLQEIIEQSISKYIVDNLFASKYMLDEQIRRTIWDMKNGSQI